METLEEAWKILDDKYGNPTNVSSFLIQSFMDLKIEGKNAESKLVILKDAVFGLYNDLKAVKEEEMLTQNKFLLN